MTGPITTDEAAYMRANCETLMPSEMASVLGRSFSTVYGWLRNRGLVRKDASFTGGRKAKPKHNRMPGYFNEDDYAREVATI